MTEGQSPSRLRRTRQIEAVVLTEFDDRFAFLRNTLGLVGMRVWQARNLYESDFLLTVTGATVLLSDVAVVDCSWHAAVDLLRADHPSTSMIIVADPVDRDYIEPAFEVGVWGVLWLPLQFDRATKLIRAAHEAAEDRAALCEDGCGRVLSGFA
jgi:DNA-binding NarL/FixJ family response regulator